MTGYEDLARTRQAMGPKLVLLLGSGLVTQACNVGARLRALPRPAPLDWYELLRGVARSFDCAAASAHLDDDVPGQTTLLWDAMVIDITARETLRPAHLREREMRRVVARRLLEDRATVELARPFVSRVLGAGFDDVLNFNFDSVLLPPRARPKPLLRGLGSRASLAYRTDAGTLWFPHGHGSDPDSIVLGAHAYGARLSAMRVAFDLHARARPPRPSERQSSWVATCLPRPLLFVGLSLSREEWTIWWLLSQRARFLARAKAKVPSYIFVRRAQPSDSPSARAAFQTLERAATLLGVTLLTFDDFEDGWTRLFAALDIAPLTPSSG